jgi:hypothetical protein
MNLQACHVNSNSVTVNKHIRSKAEQQETKSGDFRSVSTRRIYIYILSDGLGESSSTNSWKVLV